ncbi:hypothetical protein JCM8097_002548 [Rhodosporidiobolus ruineniae]
MALTRSSSTSALCTLLVLLLPALAAAQTGYGRFPCTLVNGDGTYSPNQAACTSPTPTGSEAGPNAGQGEGYTPVGSICTQEVETGAYFCGIAGAACTTNANCDNGNCVGGTCQGGFFQAYCLDGGFSPTASNTCGGIGAFCQDSQAARGLSFEDAQPVFNAFCASGYCNSNTGNCDNPAPLYGDCSRDPRNACGPGAVCDPTSFVCVATQPATTTTQAPSTTTTTTTTQAPTTAPPASGTPFTVSGAVSTTRAIAAPVPVSCGSSQAYSNCIAGARTVAACCTAGLASCQAIYDANLQNCDTIGQASYPCSSTTAADVEECCQTVFTAYFGAGGGEGSGCPV